MSRFLGLACLATFAFALPAAAEITYGGGDGSSVEAAVIILGATSEGDGVPAEYLWIDKAYPDADVEGQALLDDKGRVYDLLTLTVDGKPVEVYFDITEYFGKF